MIIILISKMDGIQDYQNLIKVFRINLQGI